ncbi:MAG: hypothetical protein M3P95_05190 [Actinomycetota bacterium]|nr:hypothetical protein [Actinomycetota bacterium]
MLRGAADAIATRARLPRPCCCRSAGPGVHPDDRRADIEAVRAPARALLDANPDVVLHQCTTPTRTAW